MTTLTDGPMSRPAASPPVARERNGGPQRRWRGFTLAQLVVMAVATVPVLLIAGTLVGWAAGLIDAEAAIEFALIAGEDPGMVVFALMLFASPVQWATGRTQIRVRKYLGIVFFLLALSNGAMFLAEHPLVDAVSAPFLVAGTAAVALATPLFLTSTHRSQRLLGMRRWRALHRLTYLVGVALILHTVLAGEPAVGTVLIGLALLARAPVVRRFLERRPASAQSRASISPDRSTWPSWAYRSWFSSMRSGR